MLKRGNRLKKEISFVARRGDRYYSKKISMYVLRTEGKESKVGFIVGRKVGKAAKRNLLKRRLREILRLYIPKLKRGLLINVYANTLNGKWEDIPPFKDLLGEVEDLLKKADILI